MLTQVEGVLVPGGFGDRGARARSKRSVTRANIASRFLAFAWQQMAAVEFARNVCALADANSTEFDSASPPL